MCGKLAGMLQEAGQAVRCSCACDIYRPAAIKQLQVVGSQAGVPVFEMGKADPVQDLRAEARRATPTDYGNDVIIVDTAGRLHIDEALMDELGDIKEAVRPHGDPARRGRHDRSGCRQRRQSLRREAGHRRALS